MITIKIITEISFKTQAEYQDYIQSDEVERITSFKDEIELARRNCAPVVYTTPRPKIGALTTSTIEVVVT